MIASSQIAMAVQNVLLVSSLPVVGIIITIEIIAVKDTHRQ